MRLLQDYSTSKSVLFRCHDNISHVKGFKKPKLLGMLFVKVKQQVEINVKAPQFLAASFKVEKILKENGFQSHRLTGSHVGPMVVGVLFGSSLFLNISLKIPTHPGWFHCKNKVPKKVVWTVVEDVSPLIQEDFLSSELKW